MDWREWFKENGGTYIKNIIPTDKEPIIHRGNVTGMYEAFKLRMMHELSLSAVIHSDK